MGNTLTMLHMDDEYQDHPHIHGEYSAGMSEKKFTEGSPPHTWGIQILSFSLSIFLRITPTYMGNTSRTELRISGAKDHPHIHGEYSMKREFLKNMEGSPPHTWGILIELFETTSVAGITPTYMGNTMCPTSSVVTDRDHPHIHGEYAITFP